MSLKNETKKYSILLTIAMLFWGGGWSALKILTYELPLDVVVFWRFFLMSVAFVPILYFFKQPFVINKKALLFIGASSVLNIAFMFASFLGMKEGLAGAGSVIITTFSPILTFVLVAILFHKKVSNTQLFGLFLGVVGGYILLELHHPELLFQGGNVYFLLCALIWAGVTLLSQYSHVHIHPIHYSFAISIVATIFTFFYAQESDLKTVFSQGKEFWAALLYLAIFGQAIATTIFFIASGKLGSQKTSSFMFLVPVFALFTAWILLDEEMQLHIIVGGLLSMLAVYFINKKF